MTRIAVTEATERKGLAFIRSLGRLGLRPIGCVEEERPTRLRSRWSEPYLSLPATIDVEELMARLRRRRVDVVAPMGSAWARRVAHHRRQLQRRFACLAPDAEAFETLYSKSRLAALCRSLDIPCAGPVDPNHDPGPFVVKPDLDLGGARALHFCDSAGSARRHLRRAPPGALIATRQVPGPTRCMRAVTFLFDRRTRLVTHAVVEKRLQYPIRGGNTVLGRTIAAPDLVERLLPIFERLSWQGPAEAECKIDPRNGTPWLLEINPRLPGYLRLFDHCRLPLAGLFVRAALGESPQAGPPPPGIVYGNPGLFLKRLRQASFRHLDGLCARELAEALLRTRWFLAADMTDPLPRLHKLLSRSR